MAAAVAVDRAGVVPEDSGRIHERHPRGAQLRGLPRQRRIAALDALASAGGELAGHAAFDAALIAELAAPKGADEAYWRAVAERYRKAAGIIVDLPTKKDAEKRADEADDVAAAIAEAAK